MSTKELAKTYLVIEQLQVERRHLREVNRDLLAALKRSAEAAHALTDDPTCNRHSLYECPTSYCANAYAAIAKAEEPITS